MRESVFVKAEQTNRCCGIATTDHREATVLGGVNNGLSNTTGTVGECFKLEHTHRAVPENGLRAGQDTRKLFNGFGSNVQAHPAFGDFVDWNDLLFCVSSKLRSGYEVNWQDNLVTVALKQALAGIDHLFLQQRLLNIHTLSSQEGVAHAPTNNQCISLRC